MQGHSASCQQSYAWTLILLHDSASQKANISPHGVLVGTLFSTQVKRIGFKDNEICFRSRRHFLAT